MLNKRLQSHRLASIIWLIYFVFWLLMSSIGFYWLTQYEERGIFDYLGFLFFASDLVFVYGFVLNKPLISRNFWKLYFYLSVAWLVAYPFMTGIDYQSGSEYKYFILAQVISYLLFTPKYIALFLYGFKSFGVWSDKNA